MGAYARTQAGFFEGDPYLGIHLKPDVDLWVRGHPDFSYRVTTSPPVGSLNMGIRDTLSDKKPCGTAVGDSFTFGVGVNSEQTWAKLLSRQIKCPVVNLGLPSACSTQYSRMLKYHGVSLRPRFVIWEAFMPDILENNWFDAWLRSGGGSFYQWATWRNYVNLSQADLKYKAHYWFMSHSITYNLAKNRIRGSGHEYQNKLTDLVFAGPYRFDLSDSLVQKGWGLMKTAISEANEAALKIGARLIVVYFPTKEEVYEDVIEKLTPVKPMGLGQPAEMLREFAKDKEMAFLDLT